MCQLVPHGELVGRGEMGHIQGFGVSCLTEASACLQSYQWRRAGEGRRGHPALSTQPAALLCSHRTGGGGLWVFFFFPTSPPHCTLPSQTLTLFSYNLTGRPAQTWRAVVRFKARWTERFFSPVIVVMLRSYSQVYWEK